MLDTLYKYSFDHVLAIEASDRQFLALKMAWEKINQTICPLFDKHQVGDFFVLMVLQNALISYQIAGSGELWWEEFTERFVVDFQDLYRLFLLKNPASDRFYNLMTTSKYNKRLYNIKTARLQKFEASSVYKKSASMYEYYHQMDTLLSDLSRDMGMKTSAKTMTFAIKMFGYAARLAYGEFISYPMGIAIPVDSRIRSLWARLTNRSSLSDQIIQEEIQQVAQKMGIPPLHLDSLLWIEVWACMKA